MVFAAGLADDIAVSLAGLGVCALLTLVIAGWLALCRRTPTGRLAASLTHISLPLVIAGAITLAPTKYWDANLVGWVLAAVALAVGAVFVVDPLRDGWRRLGEGAARWPATVLLITAPAVLWYVGTGRFANAYGRLHLLSFMGVLWSLYLAAGLVVTRAPAPSLLRRAAPWLIATLAVGRLLVTPTPAALEQFAAATPYRWVLAPLSALQMDFDGDGATRAVGFLTGTDCDDSDPQRAVGRVDIPDNGVDENCYGGDVAGSAQAAFTDQPGVAVGASDGPPRSIYLFVIDALRYDLNSRDGIDRELMPRLGALADESVRFSNFRLCSPGTRWSVPDLLAASTLGPEVSAASPPALHALTAAGYHSLFVSSEIVHLLMGSFSRGFAEHHLSPGVIDYHDDRFIQERLGFVIEEGRPQPVFAYAHLLDAHEPYVITGICDPDIEHDARYWCALREVDRQLGVLLDRLEAAGALEDAVVAVTADHGEGLGDHGLWAHGNSLFDELLHVPFMVRAPGLRPDVVDTAAGCFDVMPTLMALANAGADPHSFGADRSAPGAADGLQVARMREPGARVEAGLDLFAVVHAGHKLLYDPATRIERFYDLVADPGEQSPMMGLADADLEAELVTRLDAWMSEVVRREASDYRPNEWATAELPPAPE